MIHNKPWMYGPYNVKYPPCPILYSQKINIIPTKLNSKLPSDEKNIKKIKSWREASVKSHNLFLWESKKLTII
jgi:hypothetical protein